MFEIEALPAFNDNYIWLIKNTNTCQCAVVDPGDASPVLTWLEQHNNWQLSDILITHHHADHTGGISGLKTHTSARVLAPDNPTINKDLILTHNQLISVLGLTFQVIAVPGHTLDHIAFYCPHSLHHQQNWLFCGDTLFAGGCGRVFEGTMAQMFHSLQLLQELPDDTLIFAAHEYTVSNLRFARQVEPNNLILEQHLKECIKLRDQQIITLPSTLAVEKQTNPFLRCALPTIKTSAEAYAGSNLESELAIFSTLREWKNSF